MTRFAFLPRCRQARGKLATGTLVIKTVIMHIVAHDKGKLAEKRGRKTTGLRDQILGQRGYRSEQAKQVDTKFNNGSRGCCLQIRRSHKNKRPG